MEKIDRIFYINLKHRVDRKEHIEKEIRKIDPDLKKTERFEAVYHDIGGIGCGLSHIKVLEKSIESGYENIIVFEDDFKFLVDTNSFKNKLKKLFEFDKDYNICMLSRYIIEYNKINEDISEVIYGKNVSGVLINTRFFQTLKNNFEESVEELKKGDMSNKRGYACKNEFAIDENWKKLQGIEKKFYTFNVPLGSQIESYSDIVRQNVDYNMFLIKKI